MVATPPLVGFSDRQQPEVCPGVCTTACKPPTSHGWHMEKCGCAQGARGANRRYWARTSDPQFVDSGRTFAPVRECSENRHG
jgi:hypothetical protein